MSCRGRAQSGPRREQGWRWRKLRPSPARGSDPEPAPAARRDLVSGRQRTALAQRPGSRQAGGRRLGAWLRRRTAPMRPGHSVLGEVPGTWGTGWAQARGGGAPRAGGRCSSSTRPCRGRRRGLAGSCRHVAPCCCLQSPGLAAHPTLPSEPCSLQGPPPHTRLHPLPPRLFFPTPQIAATLRGLSPGWGGRGRERLVAAASPRSLLLFND